MNFNSKIAETLSCILFLSVSSEQCFDHGVLGVFLQHSDTTLVKVNTAMTKSAEAGPCQTAATIRGNPNTQQQYRYYPVIDTLG